MSSSPSLLLLENITGTLPVQGTGLLSEFIVVKGLGWFHKRSSVIPRLVIYCYEVLCSFLLPFAISPLSVYPFFHSYHRLSVLFLFFVKTCQRFVHFESVFREPSLLIISAGYFPYLMLLCFYLCILFFSAFLDVFCGSAKS